ncbi:hypothetical protein [Roseateles sp.]|uniref:hypothetical protein n=1 Tax=Roseateles sp. TaxID=1971397 RepID=UPI00286C746A|nr:hypothetical protein [Roseateles sp.]
MPQHRSSLTLLVACTFGLLGCAGSRHHQAPYAPRQDASAAQQRALDLAARGYPGAAHQADPAGQPLATVSQQWVVKGDPLPVTLLTPVGGSASLPLLVYLPGLGESAQAGAHWRYAWARAGYAVLSFQALEGDANAWSSALARQADFKALALQHSQAPLLTARLRMLEGVLAEARLRAASGDAPWARVDLDRLAVIGYDLGAATAMVWGARLTPIAAGQARAVIMLSPAGLSRMQAEPLLASMPPRLPLLAINSRRAADLTGVLDSAAERTRFFDAVPANSNKSLLLLNSPSHAALAGAAGMAESPNEPASQRGIKGAASRSSHGPGQHQAVMSAAPPPLLLDKGNQEAGVAIEHISIAFLNQHLRANPQAASWLQQSAATWLAGLGDWQQR